MTTKWTKGPWKAFDNAGKNMQSYTQSSGVITENNESIICGCFKDIGGTLIASANAQLIASAPDLYEALQTLVTDIRFLESHIFKEQIIKASAALRAARGEK